MSKLLIASPPGSRPAQSVEDPRHAINPPTPRPTSAASSRIASSGRPRRSGATFAETGATSSGRRVASCLARSAMPDAFRWRPNEPGQLRADRELPPRSAVALPRPRRSGREHDAQRCGRRATLKAQHRLGRRLHLGPAQHAVELHVALERPALPEPPGAAGARSRAEGSARLGGSRAAEAVNAGRVRVLARRGARWRSKWRSTRSPSAQPSRPQSAVHALVHYLRGTSCSSLEHAGEVKDVRRLLLPHLVGGRR